MIDHRTILTLLVVPGIFLGLERHRRWSRPARGAFLVFLGLTASVFCIGIVGEIRNNQAELPTWDFLGFWLHARTAVEGHNFYDPHFAEELAAPFSVSKAFRREIVDTGFWYPPPSMFLFWPLGWFDPHTALLLWNVLHTIILAIDVVLLWRIFFPRGSAVELLVCTTLACVAQGTLLTFHYSQTTFVALLALLLFWCGRRTAYGGFWVAIAVLVKPFLAVLAPCLVVGRRWRALAGLLVSAAALTLASIGAFGPRTFADYFVGDAQDPKPEWVYRERTNQSLLGFVLRATDTECGGIDCVTNPAYLTGSLVLAVITIPLGIRLARTHEAWTVALFLLFALLVYPVSQSFYSVLLIPLLLLTWRERDRVLGRAWTMTILSTTVYALSAFQNGRTTVAAYGVLWAAMTLIGLRLRACRPERHPPRCALPSGNDAGGRSGAP